MIWVKCIKQVADWSAGKRKVLQPGDWLQVAADEALRLVATGQALTAASELQRTFDFTQTGLLFWGGAPVAAPDDLALTARSADFPALPWDYTLLATRPTASMTAALGFLHLKATCGGTAWELAAQLLPDLPLASARGPETARAATLAALGDLRLPVYDTGLLWVRRTPATLDLVAAWTAELQAGADAEHAFLRVLYTRRVLLKTLPPAWVGVLP